MACAAVRLRLRRAWLRRLGARGAQPPPPLLERRGRGGTASPPSPESSKTIVSPLRRNVKHARRLSIHVCPWSCFVPVSADLLQTGSLFESCLRAFACKKRMSMPNGSFKRDVREIDCEREKPFLCAPRCLPENSIESERERCMPNHPSVVGRQWQCLPRTFGRSQFLCGR